MNINNSNSLVQKFLDENGQIDIELYLLRGVKDKEQTVVYQAYEIKMNEELKKFYKENLRNNFLKIRDEENKFVTSSYNFELQINDQLAYLDIDKISTLNEKFEKMKGAISKKELEMKRGKFQILKLLDLEDDRACYIFYYQGVKNGTNKKYAFLECDEFKLVSDNLINVGGFFHFFIDENKYLYIRSPREFEYAFKYEDHINKMRDENIERISEQNIFIDNNSLKFFKDEAVKYIRSRSMAQIDSSVIENFKYHFENRCDDLEEIKKDIEKIKDYEKAKDKYGIIVDLIDFINFDLKKIEIEKSEDTNLTPIFHLFQNKIVESYLTKEIRTALGYES